MILSEFTGNTLRITTNHDLKKKNRFSGSVAPSMGRTSQHLTKQNPKKKKIVPNFLKS